MHSPISGVVVARNRVAGEFVEDQSILRLAQLNPLKVEVIAPVEMFGSITEGMLVEVVPEHSDKGPQFATVTMVDRMIDPASGTFDVRAELPNPDLAIPSGLRCTAQFMDAPLPSEAIAAAPVEEPASIADPVEETVAQPEPTPIAEASPKGKPASETESLVASAAQEAIDSELEDPTAPESEIVTEPELELPLEPATAEIAATEIEQPTAVETVIDAEAVAALEQILASESVSAVRCEAPGAEVISGYLVLADPTNNSAATRELVDSLREKGVQELFVVAQGDRRGQVSLGFYSKMDNAEKRQAEIANQGFVVSLVPRIVEQASPACDMAEQLAGTTH